MILSLRHRFVFIENPKAGSSSLREALLPYADLHADEPLSARHQTFLETQSRQADVLLRAQADGVRLFKFGVIREPVDWALSWHAFTYPEMDFLSWWYSPFRFRFLDLTCRNQTSMFVGYDGQPAMDLLIPFERLGEASPVLSRLLGLDIRIPHRNAGEHPKAELDDDTKRRIRRTLQDDVWLHEYACMRWEVAQA